MILSPTDVAAFRAAFPGESEIDRFETIDKGGFATVVLATIAPESTKDATLHRAWSSARSLAVWLLTRSETLPDNEQYAIIVAWSKTVRPGQGHIFKCVGTTNDLRTIATSD